MNRYLKIALKALITVIAFAYVANALDLQSMAAAWQKIPHWTIIAATCFLALNVLVTGLRFNAVLRSAGFRVPISYAIKTHLISQIAGAMFFQIFGQTISRKMMLSSWGVDESSALLVTVFEKAAAIFVSFAFCLFGVYSLFGGVSFEETAGAVYLVEVVFVLLVGFFLVTRYVCRDLFGALLAYGTKRIRFSDIGVAFVWSAIGQLLVGGSYVVLAYPLLENTLPLSSLFAASFVIMFAASLPISFAGWGIREIGAVFALGVLGMSQGDAVLIGVVIGVFSLALLVLPLPLIGYFVSKLKENTGSSIAGAESSIDFRPVLYWGLPVLCAGAVFFQMQIPTSDGSVNLNLADPFAITAGVLLVSESLRRRKFPEWRVIYLPRVLLVISIILVASYCLGAWSFGNTAWALHNRLLGWSVLLCYVFAGAFCVVNAGIQAQQRLLKVFVTMGFAVAAFEVLLVLWQSAGFLAANSRLLKINLEGFALNRNAFSFQMLLTFSASLCLYAQTITQRERRTLLAASTIFLVALWFSGSRAALLALPVIITIACFRRLIPVKTILGVCVLASLVIVAQVGVPSVSVGGAIATTGSLSIVQPGSDSQHWQSILEGLAMWREHPILGAGLGAFIHQSATVFGVPLVIHNIYVWMLAELGILGFAAFSLLFIVLMLFCFEKDASPEGRFPRNVMLLALMVMTVVGMAHDMLYQRMFWFFLGVFAVQPALSTRNSSDSGRPREIRASPGSES